MQKNIFRKGLVVGIIVLFFGASIIPSISGDNEKIKDYNIGLSEKRGGNILVYATDVYNSIYNRNAFDDDLPSILGNYGYSVTVTDRIITPIITTSLLTDYDELWFMSSRSSTSGALSTAEIDAILDFRNAGHGILIMADDYRFSADANQISIPLGVTFSGLLYHGPWGSIIQPEFQSHPLSTGVTTIVSTDSDGQMNVNGGVTVVATYQGDNLIAVLDDGYGRVVFDVTFTRMMDDNTNGHNWITQGDTAQYARNIADWLNDGGGNQPDLIIEDNWIIPSTFNPGDNVIACTYINNTINTKSGDSGPFQIFWLIDHEIVCTKYFDNLPSGKSIVRWPPECVAIWPNDNLPHPFEVQLWKEEEMINYLIKEFSAVPDALVASINGPYYYQWRGEILPSFLSKTYPTISFSCSVYGGSAPYTYEWDFGDGYISTEKNPTHTYLVPAAYFLNSNSMTFHVSLFVEDSNGKQFEDITTVCIGKSATEPIACAGGPYFADPGETIYFDSSKSFDPEGGSLEYFWDFGDGGTSTQSNPSHVYPSSGLYTVTLTITNNQDKIGMDQTVAEVGYIIEFTPPFESAEANVTENEKVGFAGTEIISYPIADAETGAISFGIKSDSALCGGSKIGVKCQISGPKGHTFSVLESGRYNIFFCYNYSDYHLSGSDPDPLVSFVVAILSCGATGLLKILGTIISTGSGFSGDDGKLITELYENDILKKAKDITARNKIFGSPERTDRYNSEGSTEIFYPVTMYTMKNYRFVFGFYGKMTTSAFGIETVIKKSIDYTNFTSFKAMKLPGVISGGGSCFDGSINAYIDSSISKVDFLIRWFNASDDINLTLKKPDGSIVDPESAQTDPNITFISESTYEMYTVTDPMYGGWELLIENPSGVNYTTRVAGDTPLFIDLNLDKGEVNEGPCIPGDNILVSLNVSNLDTPITGANVITNIETPIGSEQLVLYDDGMHGDGLSDDGVYANNFSNTALEGIYNFTVIATGISDGYQFSRTALTQAIIMGVSNHPPSVPNLIGPNFGELNITHTFNTESNDFDGDKLYYWFDWDDGTNTSWLGPYLSSESCNADHLWTTKGTYAVQVKVKDIYGFEVECSNPVVINIIEQSSLKKVILFGRINNSKIDETFTSFDARSLFYFSFPPFVFKLYLSGEKLVVSNDYKGKIWPHFIIGRFNAIVVSEPTSSSIYSFRERLHNHLYWNTMK